MTLSQKVVSKLNLLTVNHITSIIVIIEVEWNVEGFVVVSALESTRGQNVTSAGREGASGEALEENYLLLLLAMIPFILIATLPLCSLIILFPNLLSQISPHSQSLLLSHQKLYKYLQSPQRAAMDNCTDCTLHRVGGPHSQSSLCDE